MAIHVRGYYDYRSLVPLVLADLLVARRAAEETHRRLHANREEVARWAFVKKLLHVLEIHASIWARVIRLFFSSSLRNANHTWTIKSE